MRKFSQAERNALTATKYSDGSIMGWCRRWKTEQRLKEQGYLEDTPEWSMSGMKLTQKGEAARRQILNKEQ